MVPLLADVNLNNYAVITVQEPWKNTWNFSSYNLSSSRFHPAGDPGGEMRVCFYVNKDINPESWNFEYITRDACTLSLRVTSESGEKEIRIHNVYNPSPTSYTSTNSPSSFPAIQRMLEAGGEQLLLHR